jgi:hypothetical protein
MALHQCAPSYTLPPVSCIQSASSLYAQRTRTDLFEILLKDSRAMDLIRALLPADELSPRALALTEHLSQLNPSSYTVWHYRARILIHGPESGPNGLGSVHERLEKELNYLDELATRNMKNYQVW